MKNSNEVTVPKTGFLGLKENWKSDMVSGFLVFLLALPLSLGIAKASGFPAAMGVFTAIVGGLFGSMFKVSELSIKGPAAGLITVCSAAVIEFGGGEKGIQMTCAVILVMAVIQVIFGFLKFGSLSDFFPHSAVHGMLAAIGIIIIAKQIPVLLGNEPTMYKGEGPLELLADIPSFISHAHWHIAIVGILGLAIMIVLPMIKVKFMKKVPAPMVVLLITIPLSVLWHFKTTEPSYSLVVIGDFWSALGFNVDFSGITSFPFWKYVFMFLFVNSLESLLTVKAVDNLDPYKRESSYNGDLKGLGASNAVSAIFGGMPMISEVVRSSANIGFGAITKWSNFFHGGFLLLSMIFLIPFIELTPNASLAAMLIYAGYRLASPKEFRHVYHIGPEQLAIFCGYHTCYACRGFAIRCCCRYSCEVFLPIYTMVQR
jgi:MFS superfamily sulfate permease-like transporter